MTRALPFISKPKVISTMTIWVFLELERQPGLTNHIGPQGCLVLQEKHCAGHADNIFKEYRWCNTGRPNRQFFVRDRIQRFLYFVINILSIIQSEPVTLFIYFSQSDKRTYCSVFCGTLLFGTTKHPPLSSSWGGVFCCSQQRCGQSGQSFLRCIRDVEEQQCHPGLAPFRIGLIITPPFLISLTQRVFCCSQC